MVSALPAHLKGLRMSALGRNQTLSRLCEPPHAIAMPTWHSICIHDGNTRHGSVALCSSGLDLVATAYLLGGLQQLSRSSAWRRSFWPQLRLTFSTNSRLSGGVHFTPKSGHLRRN